MLRSRILLTALFVLLGAGGAAAQKVTKVTPLAERKGLRVEFESFGGGVPASLENLANYKLFTVNPKRPEDAGLNVSDLFGKDAKLECAYLGGYCEILSESLGEELARELGKAAKDKRTFVLVVEKFKDDERAVVSFTPDAKAEIVGPLDPKQQNTEVRVVGAVPLKHTAGLKLKREELELLTPGRLGQLRSETADAETGKVLDALAKQPGAASGPLSGSLYAVPVPEPVAVREVTPHDERTLRLEVARLSDGRVHHLTAEGIVAADDPKAKVTAGGKIDIAGSTPAAPEAARYSGTFSTDAGVGKKAVFDLRLNIAPRNRPPNPKTDGIWEPNLDANLGFRSTQSRRSVIFGAYYTQNFFVCLRPVVKRRKDQDAEDAFAKQMGASAPESTPPVSGERRGCGGETKILEANEYLTDEQAKALNASFLPTYAGWRRTPWYRLSHAKFSIGPKFEIDQTLEKLNVVGNARFDFFFHRWLGTVGFKRDLLLNDLAAAVGGDRKATMGKLDGPRLGFRLVPYLSVDLGRRAYSNTVTKTVKRTVNGETVDVKTSAEVPEFGIARGTLGLNSTVEWRTFSIPTTLTFDESIVFIGLRESIGFTNDEGAFLRQLRGFHPRFVTAIDFAIDPSRHYSFNITHENGRSAPNFEYLNKVTAGIKLTY